jgi:RNA polymerase sigma-70 factor (ECF subfamily)
VSRRQLYQVAPSQAAESCSEPSDPVLLPATETSDAEFLDQLKAGRPAAFAELFDRYAPVVRRALGRILGESSDIEDLVHDTFLVVVRRVGTLRDAHALRSFVYSIAVRVARNELRRRRVRRLVPWAHAPPALRSVPPHDAAAAEALRRLQELLERLAPDEHIAFVLRRVEELPLSKAASAAGCSLATLKRRLSRAERRFVELVRDDPVLAARLPRSDRS